MTGLLVSVRDTDEAAVALAAGVDVIDIKEPFRGSLGAASAETVASVLSCVAGRAVVSAACGELVDWDAKSSWTRQFIEVECPARPRLAKIALARCDGLPDWQDHWRVWAETLPAGTSPVGVIYADRAIAQSPPWEAIVALANEIRAPYVLVDTYDKSSGTLFDHWSAAMLRAFAEDVSVAGLGIVLAGSLRGDDILRATEFEPDFIAVRGAACRGGRTGAVDAAAIRRILESLGRTRDVARREEAGNIQASASELR